MPSQNVNFCKKGYAIAQDMHRVHDDYAEIAKALLLINGDAISFSRADFIEKDF